MFCIYSAARYTVSRYKDYWKVVLAMAVKGQDGGMGREKYLGQTTLGQKVCIAGQ